MRGLLGIGTLATAVVGAAVAHTPGGAETARPYVVSIARFRPTEMSSGLARRSETVALSAQRPAGLRGEPPAPDMRRWFGRLDLGAEPGVLVALDERMDGSRVLHVDRNGNRDLSDDGPPLRNQGSTGFAAALRLPVETLRPASGWRGEVALWVYLPVDALWTPPPLRFYSRTELVGNVEVDGSRYRAFIVDGPPVDGDYTNDGICLDLDHSGDIDRSRECSPPGDSLEVRADRVVQEGGVWKNMPLTRRYRFDVRP